MCTILVWVLIIYWHIVSPNVKHIARFVILNITSKIIGITWLAKVWLVALFSHSGSTDMLVKGREEK
jgi:hypothetical protein